MDGSERVGPGPGPGCGLGAGEAPRARARELLLQGGPRIVAAGPFTAAAGRAKMNSKK